MRAFIFLSRRWDLHITYISADKLSAAVAEKAASDRDMEKKAEKNAAELAAFEAGESLQDVKPNIETTTANTSVFLSLEYGL